MRLITLTAASICLILSASNASPATYYVAGARTGAADTNPGTASRPWRTIGRAGTAAELRPGDTVLIESGVYREAARITRSGTVGAPITFAAAPGERVVIKGSSIVTGTWSRVTAVPNVKEPYPNAFRTVWKIHLDDSYFQGFPPGAGYISSVFLEDNTSLQQIGRDAVYTDPHEMLPPVGHGLTDIYLNSFLFDRQSHTLYVSIDGDPSWALWEVGTIPFPLKISNVHDVNVEGLEVRQNRQPGGQWPMIGVTDCERVTLADCKFTQADFGGISVTRCRNVTLERCDASFNGCVGIALSASVDCAVDGCRMYGNNTRHFDVNWVAGGAKCIPGNLRATFRNCEAAYNSGPGIWFDTGNTDCRMIHNVVYRNNSGIFCENNPGGGLIADNLAFANNGRGIYVSRSSGVNVVHNTVADNNQGIVVMPGDATAPAVNDLVQNNLLLRNYVAGAAGPRGCDLILFLDPDSAGKRRLMTNHSRSNLFEEGLDIPTVRAEWGTDIRLDTWQRRFGEDAESRALPFGYRVFGDTFRITEPQATAKRAIATPLPAGLPWTPANPALVGSSIANFP